MIRMNARSVLHWFSVSMEKHMQFTCNRERMKKKKKVE